MTGSIIYDIDMIEDLGEMLPAILSPDAVDGRRSKMGRSITTEGNEQSRVYRVTIPPEALEALGYDLDRIKEASETDSPVGITVYAGPEMLAFEYPDQRTVQIDRSQFDAEEKRDYSDRDRDEEGQFAGSDGDGAE